MITSPLGGRPAWILDTDTEGASPTKVRVRAIAGVFRTWCQRRNSERAYDTMNIHLWYACGGCQSVCWHLVERRTPQTHGTASSYSQPGEPRLQPTGYRAQATYISSISNESSRSRTCLTQVPGPNNRPSLTVSHHGRWHQATNRRRVRTNPSAQSGAASHSLPHALLYVRSHAMTTGTEEHLQCLS